jgi:hypothetical protein
VPRTSPKLKEKAMAAGRRFLLLSLLLLVLPPQLSLTHNERRDLV